nr:anthranilate synthase component I family protein [Acanthopleuribacter pedis]
MQTYDRTTQTLSAQALSPEKTFRIQGRFTAFHNNEVPTGWRESEQRYGEKIKTVQHHIYEGNFYQANLSQRFCRPTNQAPTETYRLLRARNPSPFMGIFRFFDYWVLSGSPERLVEKRGNFISARPIAGTQPRYPHDPAADQKARDHLTSCAKEQAEHLMLVDLIRNDLGRVARAGSVQVREFAVIETYSHVHHLVSQVEANLAETADVWELIASVFPGGTITGAPKISCMQTLAELEREKRGPYTGAMGYIGGDGNLDLNILIRTIIQVDRHICFHAGGGIVADSHQTAEYLETRHKCAALMEALNIEV